LNAASDPVNREKTDSRDARAARGFGGFPMTTPARSAAEEAGGLPAFAAAAAVAGLALAMAAAIRLIHGFFPQQPERAVLITGLGFAAVLALGPGLYLARMRRESNPWTAGLTFLAASSVLLLAAYFYWVSWYVNFPADILTWSEGDFINDIIKFSVGYPLYSPQANNDAFNYPPGPQLLTYLLAWLAGKAGSISFYRAIQVGYTAAAAFLALLSCRRLLRQARCDLRPAWLWNAFFYAALLLMGANSITNRFSHNLHGDALAQLTALAAFYLLLVYIDTRDRRVLAAMALIAPIGFLVKQSLVIWAAWYAGFLLLWDRNWKRTLAFSAATGALTAAVIGACYAIWGQPFFYWTFTVLGSHGVSPLRSFQHVLDSWTYFAGGLLGGAAVLRFAQSKSLVGAWLVWLGLISVEAYTSGIAWMLNHIGPGCLIAGVWFLAGLAVVWSRVAAAWKARTSHAPDWIAAAAAAFSVALLFAGMGMVRIPAQPLSNDAYRYVRDIEAQFRGLPSRAVLLDAGGSWIYERDGVVMGDRAPCIGERGHSGTGDFSGILARIAAHRYSKILVRDLHEADFWYEHSTWPKPSGIRQALLDHYRETGRIPAAEPPLATRDRAEDPYLFDEITVLEPKTPE